MTKLFKVYRKNSLEDSRSYLVGTYKQRGRADAKVNAINEEYGAYIAYKEVEHV